MDVPYKSRRRQHRYNWDVDENRMDTYMLSRRPVVGSEVASSEGHERRNSG